MKLGYAILYVNDVGASISFYEKAFGLKRKFLHESGQYGEMETGQTTLSFANRNSSKPEGLDLLGISKSRSTFPIEIAFTTKNVTAAFKQAIDSGCKVVSEPKKKPWGQIVSYVLDSDGFLVEICSPIS